MLLYNLNMQESVLSAHKFYEDDSCYEEPLLSSFEKLQQAQKQSPQWGSLLWPTLIGKLKYHIWYRLLLVVPFISHFKHGYFKLINELLNNLNVCMCNE